MTAGLGLRRGMFDDLARHRGDVERAVDFLEVAPENWIGVGGRLGRAFREYAERFPLVCHGLSLSLGSPAPLDVDFVREVKAFLDTHGVDLYSEHLSYCSDHGHLYDLMPIPFTEEAVDHVASRIRRVQDILERRIAVENVSYYAAPGQNMDELAFVNAVLERADCRLLLDVNNIHVNSVNFGYDATAFLDGLAGERTAYIHVAGHRVEAPDLRIDTHGADVVDAVWALLGRAYENFGVLPTVLERDFNYPPVPQLLREVDTIRTLQERASAGAPQPPRGGAPEVAAPLAKTAPPFESVQRAFAAHVRDPDRHPVPVGVDGGRMAVYVGLVHRNIEGFLARTFRTARAVLPDVRWRAIVADFIARHASRSPYFRDISTEFLRYLETERNEMEDPPFLAELCHYEWTRRSLDQSDETVPEAVPAPALLDARLVLSPLAWPLHYRFPVHRIGPDLQPGEETPTWLIVYRDRADRVRRIESNAATTRLVALLGEHADAGSALAALADELGRDVGQLRAFAEGILRRLVEADVASAGGRPVNTDAGVTGSGARRAAHGGLGGRIVAGMAARCAAWNAVRARTDGCCPRGKGVGFASHRSPCTESRCPSW